MIVDNPYDRRSKNIDENHITLFSQRELVQMKNKRASEQVMVKYTVDKNKVDNDEGEEVDFKFTRYSKSSRTKKQFSVEDGNPFAKKHKEKSKRDKITSKNKQKNYDIQKNVSREIKTNTGRLQKINELEQMFCMPELKEQKELSLQNNNHGYRPFFEKDTDSDSDDQHK